VQNLGYTYDKLGNPLSRADANTDVSESFTYDGLNRLTTSSVNISPTPRSKTFSYDPIATCCRNPTSAPTPMPRRASRCRMR
jgi:RHS Repeat